MGGFRTFTENAKKFSPKQHRQRVGAMSGKPCARADVDTIARCGRCRVAAVVLQLVLIQCGRRLNRRAPQQVLLRTSRRSSSAYAVRCGGAAGWPAMLWSAGRQRFFASDDFLFSRLGAPRHSALARRSTALSSPAAALLRVVWCCCRCRARAHAGRRAREARRVSDARPPACAVWATRCRDAPCPPRAARRVATGESRDGPPQILRCV